MKQLTDGKAKKNVFQIVAGILLFVYRRFRTIVLIAVVIECIAVYKNPLLPVQQGKAFGRYMAKKSYKLQYELIKEKHGETIANMWDSKNTWVDFGQSMNKCWKDSMVIFGK